MSKLLFLLLVCLFSSCVEFYDIKLDGATPRLVVDAIVTNEKSAQYVRLLYSSPGISDGNIDTIPVKNALITLTDNLGNVDTLIARDYQKDELIWEQEKGYYKVGENPKTNQIDTIFGIETYYTVDRGFYHTEWFKANTGLTYVLRIDVDGKTYTASSYLEQLPVIDSLRFEERLTNKGDESEFIPVVYFRDNPEKENYYAFDFGYQRLFGEGGLWMHSVISDEYFKDEIYGIEIGKGISSVSTYDPPNYVRGDRYNIDMSTVDRAYYEYVNALKSQLESDGGIYKPIPSTPPSNIDNGALGFFRVSAVHTFSGEVR